MKHKNPRGLLFFIPLLFLTPIIFPKNTSADVVVNEVYPNPPGSSEEDEFVELYNNGSQTVDLKDWIIGDLVKEYVIESGEIPANGFISFLKSVTGIQLNNSGTETVTLKNNGSEVKDQMTYTSSIEGKSWSRIPDGTGNWVNGTDISPESKNIGLIVTPTPTTTPIPTPTSTPQDSEAKYTVLKPKNGDGEEISNVKIYLNGNYTGNHDEEVYIFCQGCKCGSNQVDCGFGTHAIKLERNGYEDWSKTFEINAGDELSDSPVMTLLSSETSESFDLTPAPTPKLSSSTLKPKIPTPKPTQTPDTNEPKRPTVLGITEGEDTTPNTASEEAVEKKPLPSISYLLIITGLLFVGFAVTSYFLKNKKGIIENNEEI